MHGAELGHPELHCILHINLEDSKARGGGVGVNPLLYEQEGKSNHPDRRIQKKLSGESYRVFYHLPSFSHVEVQSRL